MPVDTPDLSELTFEPWPKIARLNRETVITEKIDGTNAAVVVRADGLVYAQSRTRIITPTSDNFGFANRVHDNQDDLREQLGEGRHFGEWWGSGIQRTYGLKEKRFSLFNTHRWHGGPADQWRCIEAPLCFVVPTVQIIDRLDATLIDNVMRHFLVVGSFAAPGFNNPEGVVIYHRHSGACFKVPFEGDDKGKDFGG